MKAQKEGSDKVRDIFGLFDAGNGKADHVEQKVEHS